MASLVIGGNGALGRAVVSNLKKVGQKVLSMDTTHNVEADFNVLVNPEHQMKEQGPTLVKQTLDLQNRFNSIICVAGGFEIGNIKDTNIFESYQRQDRLNFQSALLAGHIATKSLNDQGLLLFTGAAAVFERPVNYAYAYYLTKSATHALALQMAELKEIPITSSVVTILPQIIDTEANRLSMPGADMSKWAPPDKIASLIRNWVEGDNRPANGSFAKLNFENGVVFPTFL